MRSGSVVPTPAAPSARAPRTWQWLAIALYATAVTPIGPEAPGSALGDTVTFGAGATAEIIISGGAEWDGTTYVGNNVNNGVGQTTVVGAVAAGADNPGYVD